MYRILEIQNKEKHSQILASGLISHVTQMPLNLSPFRNVVFQTLVRVAFCACQKNLFIRPKIQRLRLRYQPLVFLFTKMIFTCRDWWRYPNEKYRVLGETSFFFLDIFVLFYKTSLPKLANQMGIPCYVVCCWSYLLRNFRPY